jgi:Tol biopolymer transport system component
MSLEVGGIIKFAAFTIFVFLAFGVEGRTLIRAVGPTQISFGAVAELNPQVSPDGLKIAFEYFAAKGGKPQIWVMDRHQGFDSARPVVDNERFNAEFSWSPDGKWISYITDVDKTNERIVIPQIRKIRLSDGYSQRITTPGKWGVLGDSTSWRGDQIVFSDTEDIYAVSASGGDVAKVIDVQSRIPSATPSQIRWSPDGRRLAFTVTRRDSEQSSIWVANVKSKDVTRVTHLAADDFPVWLDNEHLVFTRGMGPKSEDGGITGNEARVCLVSLKAGGVDCLTSGYVDFAPWIDRRTGELFLARIAGDAFGRTDIVTGFHIWKFRLTR